MIKKIKDIQQLNQDIFGNIAVAKDDADSDTTQTAQPIQLIQPIPAGNIEEPVHEVHEASEREEEIQKPRAQPRNDAARKKCRTQGKSVWKDLRFLLIEIVSIILAFVLLFTFLFGLVRNQDPSMDPAVKDGDLVVFYRYKGSGYAPGDAIAFEKNGKTQIKRVVATAGDTVDVTEDGLIINGSLQQEFGIYHKTERYEEGAEFPLTVQEGQVFVLGDRRTGSTDSRIYGAIEIKDTLGKVITIIRRRNI